MSDSPTSALLTLTFSLVAVSLLFQLYRLLVGPLNGLGIFLAALGLAVAILAKRQQGRTSAVPTSKRPLNFVTKDLRRSSRQLLYKGLALALIFLGTLLSGLLPLLLVPIFLWWLVTRVVKGGFGRTVSSFFQVHKIKVRR